MVILHGWNLSWKEDSAATERFLTTTKFTVIFCDEQQLSVSTNVYVIAQFAQRRTNMM